MQELQLHVPAATAVLAPVRSLLGIWLNDINVVDDRWSLIVTELVTNSIEASEPGTTIALDARLEPPLLTLEVANEGVGPDMLQIHMPGVESTRGRGMPIVAALTSTLVVRTVGNQTVVTASGPVSMEPHADLRNEPSDLAERVPTS